MSSVIFATIAGLYIFIHVPDRTSVVLCHVACPLYIAQGAPKILVIDV